MQMNQNSNMSSASQTLRNLAHKLLTGSECAELKSAIQGFKKDRSVLTLCTFLYKILSTPEKMQILLAVYPMIPQDLQPDFDSLCSLQFDNYDITVRPKIMDKYGTKKTKKGSHRGNKGNEKAPVMVSVEQLQRFHTPRDNYDSKQDSVILNTDEIADTKTAKKSEGVSHERASPDRPTCTRTIGGVQQHRKHSKTTDAVLDASETLSTRHCSDALCPRVPPIELHTSQSSNNSFNSCQFSTYTPKNINVRKVKLERKEGQSLGFAIRGGTDLKSGIYVSHVDVGGQAEIWGLRVGERILKVNDVTFKNVSHAEAVAVLKASCRLTIYAALIGHMPGSTPSRTQRDNCSGHSARGEIVENESSAIESGIKSEKLTNITLVAQDDNWLGCSIRGGVDHGMNVMVASVDPDSPAYKAGLKIGQHIVKVNGVNVDTLTHMQVINLITASNIVSLDVKSDSSISSFNSVAHQITKPCSQQMSEVNWQDFEKGLMNTLPLCTSKPLPPENLPKLAVNTQSNCLSNAAHTDQESTTDSICANNELDTAEAELTICDTRDHTCGATNNSMCNSNQCYSKCKHSKFDTGTIKLNLADAHGYKDIVKTAKIIDIASKIPTRKRGHVKEIFANIPAVSSRRQFCVNAPKPANSKTFRSESCRSTVTGSRTPHIERSNSMNIMGSPCSNITRETFPVVPPQDQLQDARMIAKIQIQQELTGKHIILSPNVPSSQRPILAAHFLRKLLNTTYKNSSGSTEIFRTDQTDRHGSPGNMAMLGISKWGSAYDFIANGELDED